MKKMMLCGAILLMNTGCSTMNNTQAGAVGGGVFGGILGTMVGIATGHPLEGAAIGAGIGAGTGALVGHSEDKAERRHVQAVEHAIRNPKVPIDEVIRMSQSRISDEVIVNHIASSGSVYQLSGADIEFMKQHGVSDRVVIFMQSRRMGAVVVGAPPPVVIVEPPPPVVGIGIGVGPYHHRRW